MPQQEDLYLRLSQILECEIWHHKQTRAELFAEQCRNDELQIDIQQQAHVMAQWQEACQTSYASLEEHRIQNASLKREMEELAVELARSKRLTSDPFVGAAAKSGMAEMTEAGFKKEPSSEPVGGEGGANGDEGGDGDPEAWWPDFIRDVQEHLGQLR
ncbi:hypothetical protein K491DRAFT_720530 [Lophiostoma macrostomum CBS 122681]|uniref:Uncharacterized protein n=1 Tax=Lophiostoma macrostomum CBS 122681 TaxID=1314788 RepID=A0A6A6SSL3_9PLEO|nr:hypothetical protein K491DRAFT_720530 [Lophiostoma macrostomum CBS 122681]